MSEEGTVFEAVIVPHRSLGRLGLRWLAGALFSLSLTASIVLWLAGAWPVIGFTGLESALAVWLIRRHALGPTGTELLTLSADGVRVVSQDAKGRSREQSVPGRWLQVTLEERLGRVPALWLRGGSVTVEVAAALGEDQKRDLAAALQAAVHRLHHPLFDNPQLAEE